MHLLDIPKQTRPREKLLAMGSQALTDAELLAEAAKEIRASAHPEQANPAQGQRPPDEDPPATGSSPGASEPLF
jgi:hypothetical protein